MIEQLKKDTIRVFVSYIFAIYSLMFVHLNCHSNHSFLAGANHIEDLVHTAANMGCPALALTDTNGLYGAIAFCQAAKIAGIHPVFGVEITSKRSSPLSPSKPNSKNTSGRTAKN